MTRLLSHAGPKLPLRTVTVLIILVGGAFFSLGLFDSLDSVLQAIKSIPVQYYFILLSLSLTSYLTRFLRWLVLLLPLQPDIPIYKHAVIYFTGFAMAATPGKSGEVIRSLYLKPLRIDYPVSIAAFFTERLLDVLVVATLATLSLGIITNTEVWLFIIGSLILGVILLLRSKSIVTLLRLFSRRRLGVVAEEFHSIVHVFLSNGSLLKILPLSLVAWASQGISLVIIVSALGFEANPLFIVGIYCLSILIGAASFIPGGIGVIEGSIVLLLTSLGMEPTSAIAASIVSRLVTFWFAMVLGLLALVCVLRTSPNAYPETS